MDHASQIDTDDFIFGQSDGPSDGSRQLGDPALVTGGIEVALLYSIGQRLDGGFHRPLQALLVFSARSPVPRGHDAKRKIVAELDQQPHIFLGECVHPVRVNGECAEYAMRATQRE